MELIDIARVSAADWRPEIIAMAEKGLEKRGITQERQQEIIDDYHRFVEYIEAGETSQKEWNRQESYSLGRKAVIFFLSPFLLYSFFSKLSMLRQDGFQMKHRQYIVLTVGGWIFWILFIFFQLWMER